MPSIEYLYPHIAPFLLVMARVSGLLVFAPILSSPMIPVRFKALLTLMFSIAVYATLPAGQMRPIGADVFTLAAAVASQGLIGVFIGLVAALPVYAVQLGGQLMDQQIGIALGAVYNPALDSEGTVLGDMLMYIAMAVFIAAGGLDAMLGALVTSFGRVPVTELSGWGPGADLGTAVGMLGGIIGAGFEFALRVAAPVLCIILVETVASALIMKTMPQVNIMSVGFAVKVIVGIGAVIAGLGAIEHVVWDEVVNVGRAVMQWAGG